MLWNLNCDLEELLGLVCLTALAIIAMLWLPDGVGKEVALTVVGGISGYLTRAAVKS